MLIQGSRTLTFACWIVECWYAFFKSEESGDLVKDLWQETLTWPSAIHIWSQYAVFAKPCLDFIIWKWGVASFALSLTFFSILTWSYIVSLIYFQRHNGTFYISLKRDVTCYGFLSQSQRSTVLLTQIRICLTRFCEQYLSSTLSRCFI